MLKSNRKIGIILEEVDELYPTKYFVKIPVLTNQKILVQNGLTSYTAVNNGGIINYSGTYFPLQAGTKVIIEFLTEELTTGRIIGIEDDSIAVPPGQTRENYYLIMETKNGSKVYFDEYKNRFHISNANRTDFYMDDQSIILQTSDESNTQKSFLELSENGFLIKFGDKALVFNDSGFSISSKNSNTFFNITDKGIAMKGEEFLSLDTQKLDIRGESVNLQSLGNFHIRGSVLNLTGTQKASLNSSVVHIEGWLSTYIKSGMTLNLESKIFYKTQSLVSDEINLAFKHTYSSVESRESSLSAETSTFKANAISTIANDGLVLNNLGVATSVAPSLATSLNATSLSLTGSFTAFGTFMSTDNIGSSVVGAILTDNSIADSASVATPKDKSMIGILPYDNKTFLNNLKDLNSTFKRSYSDTVTDYSALKTPTFNKDFNV